MVVTRPASTTCRTTGLNTRTGRGHTPGWPSCFLLAPRRSPRYYVDTSIKARLPRRRACHRRAERIRLRSEHPGATAEKLPPPGARETPHPRHLSRGSQTLYGFATPADRDFFRMMIENVTGVGPKMALTIMSRLSLPSLESAIRMGDIATLAKCPGIGKKTPSDWWLSWRGAAEASGGGMRRPEARRQHPSRCGAALSALGTKRRTRTRRSGGRPFHSVPGDD